MHINTWVNLIATKKLLEESKTLNNMNGPRSAEIDLLDKDKAGE